QVAAGDQFLDEQAGHDGLARARVVREQEAQGLAGQHCLVHRRDLVWQGLDQRGMDSQDRVEQVGEADAVRFRDKAERGAVAIAAPGASLLYDFQPRLVLSVEDLVSYPTSGITIDERERIGAVPLYVDDGNGGIGKDSADIRSRSQIF